MLLAERRLIGGVIGETPSELSSAPGQPRRLPDDLLRQASQRLEIMALVAAVLWALGPVLEHLAMYLAPPEDPRWWQYHTIDNIAIGCVAVSLALFVFLRRGTRDPSTVMDLALVYMVAMAFAIGVLIHYGAPSATPPDASLPMITWIGPLILMFAAIVPAAPWKMFVAGLAAASMDSIGMLVGGAMGTYDFGPSRNLLLMHYPNFLMLGVAVVVSHVVTRLGQQVSKERELGSYRLGERLGRGGMGEVYRATHRCLAKAPADRPPTAGALDRLLTEIVIEPWTEEQARRWWTTAVVARSAG